MTEILFSIREIFEYRDMINSLVHRELRGKYAKSVLGFLWAFLGPLFQILIYSLVFTLVFHNDMPYYYIFLMTGMIPWTFFSDSFGQGAGTIINNSEMVKKIYFPRSALVIAEVNAKLVNMLLSFVVVGSFILLSGVGFSRHVLLLPLIILIEYCLTLGLSLMVSAITVYLRDMEYIVNVVLMAWIWGTPIMYNIHNVDLVYQRILFLNPFTEIIECYHCILYYHVYPQVQMVIIAAAAGIVFLAAGFLLFEKTKKHFAEEM